MPDDLDEADSAEGFLAGASAVRKRSLVSQTAAR